MALLFRDLSKREILIIADRQKKNIYNALKAFLGREIGTYNSIFSSFTYTEEKHRDDLNSITKRMDFVLGNLSVQE